MSMELLVSTGIGFVTACGIYLMLRGRKRGRELLNTTLAEAATVALVLPRASP